MVDLAIKQSGFKLINMVDGSKTHVFFFKLLVCMINYEFLWFSTNFTCLFFWGEVGDSKLREKCVFFVLQSPAVPWGVGIPPNNWQFFPGECDELLKFVDYSISGDSRKSCRFLKLNDISKDSGKDSSTKMVVKSRTTRSSPCFPTSCSWWS
jgi:hypothetical protein